MNITHSFVGTTIGKFRCLFFLLLEDYIEAQSKFVRELDEALERFARKMMHAGVLVRPFSGDIEATRSHILEKPWSPSQRAEICNTPGLLMIGVDFDTFDPRQHPWLYISLGLRLESGRSHGIEFADVLNKLAQAVCDADTDVFDAANAIIHEVQFHDFAKVFEAKPGVFGFSIDLIQGAKLIHRLWLKLTKGKHILSAIVKTNGWTRCPDCGIFFATHSKGSWDGHRHTSCGTYLNLIADEASGNSTNTDGE